MYRELSSIFYEDKAEYQRVYESRFFGESTIRFPIEIAQNQAFCVITPQILNRAMQIQRLCSEIDGIIRRLPQIAITRFVEKCLIDEIILTNGIEGVHSTRKEVIDALDDRPPVRATTKAKRLQGLVRKYKKMHEDELSFSTCQDVRALYDEIVLPEIEDEKDYPDGLWFRKEQVEVQSETQKAIHKGVFPESNIINAMEKALSVLSDESIEPLIRIAVFHYFLGYIHPFYDGNGRLSRFVSSYYLANEVHPLLGLRISYTIKDKLSAYYKAFKVCNEPKNGGEVTHFVHFFLEVVEESTRNLKQALQSREENLNYFTENIICLPYAAELGDIYEVLIQATLFAEDGVSKKELAKHFKVGAQTIHNKLQKIPKEYLQDGKRGREKVYRLNRDAFERLIQELH